MKRVSATTSIRIMILLLAAMLLSVTGGWAKPTTPEQAKGVVTNWLSKEAVPLGAPLGAQVKQVQSFADASGNPAYYVVYLSPKGMVLVPADDLVEPIIGFLPEGTYDPSPVNPLGALVSKDIPARVKQARLTEAQGLEYLAPGAPEATAQRKWAYLSAAGAGTESLEFGLPGLSDVRVAPFVQSRWSQTTVDDSSSGLACYNYFGFPFPAGTAENYPCGCVATAMAQLMRYWNYPTVGVGTGVFQFKVDGGPVEGNLRGGNGYGSPYDWGSMILDPLNSGANEIQRQAIGALTHDAGIAAKMSYGQDGSSAFMFDAATALANTFKYSNAINGSANPNSIPAANFLSMINPNLNARYPVLLGIYKTSGGDGHAIVCDGYGYDFQSMYHHLNMGWSGYYDAWYNLPLVYLSPSEPDAGFNSVGDVIHNVYLSGSGEIIAGRVTYYDGTPVIGATVTATKSGGSTYSTATDAKGVYAIVKVPSSSSYTVRATYGNLSFNSHSVTTGTSTSGSIISGNLWGVDFSESSILNQALDNYSIGFSAGGAANWFEETGHKYYGPSAAQSGNIAYGQATHLRTTVTGPGTLSFYWAASSTVYYNRLALYLDDAYLDTISGDYAWTKKSVKIPEGSHTVTWTYSKATNPYGTFGSDCGWVDKVVYTPTRTGGGILPILDLLLD